MTEISLSSGSDHLSFGPPRHTTNIYTTTGSATSIPDSDTDLGPSPSTCPSPETLITTAPNGSPFVECGTQISAPSTSPLASTSTSAQMATSTTTSSLSLMSSSATISMTGIASASLPHTPLTTSLTPESTISTGATTTSSASSSNANSLRSNWDGHSGLLLLIFAGFFAYHFVFRFGGRGH